MAARVFISCGQATEEERNVSNELERWFRSERYDPYVAVQVQTIGDLNAGIIEALKTSDYYVFINFRRDKIVAGKDEFHRGSLYSHQELAIAYAFGFEHFLVVNHKDVKDEGVQKFIVTNIPEFENGADVLPLVTAAVQSAHWTPSYSRHLSLKPLRWAGEVEYGDHAGRRRQKTLHGDVKNNRSDRAAYHVVAHLNEVIDLNGRRQVNHGDRMVLKASGFQGYEHTIWPNSYCSFDLLAVSVEDPRLIFLNSSLDLIPRTPIIQEPGVYELRYRFIAEGYPLLERRVRLEHTGDIATVKTD